MNTISVCASGSYQVHIGKGLLSSLGAETAGVITGRKAVILSDETVWAIYGQPAVSSLESAAFQVFHYVVSPGENSKNSQNFLEILNFLATNRISRADCIIALGGGVVGDLAGFCAACYMRGIAFIQVPTTLLAMTDSSVGGKTAIDLPAGKNLCGVFHQPSLVLCDTDTLCTLPESVFREGCSEIIKYGILYDPVLFAHLEATGMDFDREYVICRCVELKKNTVEADEFDNGSRMFLNLGHTIGHAIEKESDYAISHGQAVAIGLAAVAKASEIFGYCDQNTCRRILSILDQFGLPANTELSCDTLHRQALHDKKSNGTYGNIIVPRAIGNCDAMQMDEHQLLSFLRAGLRREVTIKPTLLSGTISAPASKSVAHRVFLCAAISDRPTDILCGPLGNDVNATILCLQALGATITRRDFGYTVIPIQTPPAKASLPCAESGSTLRFLLPLAGALGVEATFLLEGRLSGRPLSPLWEEMERMGCHLSRPTKNTVLCQGQLQPGKYSMDGSVSSQFISGLMMPLTLLPGSSLSTTGHTASRRYIDITQQILNCFPSGSPICVEGDWSSAAAFLAANYLGSVVQVLGLNERTCQADQKILTLLPKFNASCTIDADQIPDLIPILAVIAACKQGAVFTNISRLRLKESDRVEAILSMLKSLGGRAEADENTLTVFPSRFCGGTVDPRQDHRIAMAAAIAATVCENPVTILDAHCVGKSYPGFWLDYQTLGGKL